MRAGACDVFHGDLDGDDVALKLPGSGADPAFLAEHSVLFSRLFSAIGRADDPAPPPAPAELLAHEAARIRASRGTWNHDVLSATTIRRGDSSDFGLVMPWHPGPTFAGAARPRAPSTAAANAARAVASARRRGPRRPARRQHHPRPRARLLRADRPSRVPRRPPRARGRQPHPLRLHHAPALLPAAAAVLRPVLPAARRADACRPVRGVPLGAVWLRRDRPNSIAGGATTAFAEHITDRAEPAPADLLAVGILYYEALTGAHPFEDAEFTAPGWLGAICRDGFRGNDTGFDAALARIARPVVPPAARASDVHPAESALALALLELRVHDLETLQQFAVAAALTATDHLG